MRPIILGVVLALCSCGDESGGEPDTCYVITYGESCGPCPGAPTPGASCTYCATCYRGRSCPEQDREGGGCFVAGVLIQCQASVPLPQC
jgi:hypothetical protein